MPASTSGEAWDAVLVLSFGGPEGPDDVMPFLERVAEGRAIPPARLEVVAARYRRFGGVSPINASTRAFVAALADDLAAHGSPVPVYWGNRNWHPFVEDAVGQMSTDGVRRAACVVTSAYPGYSSSDRYVEDIARARAAVGPGAPTIEKLPPFFDRPGFVDAYAASTIEALHLVGPAELVFSAHSVPLEQAGAEAYAGAVEWAAGAVIDRIPEAPPWSLAWQSRSGAPTQPWLEPDVAVRLEEVAARGTRAVVVVPIGFVADHMEVVYDLDVQAREQAERLHLAFARAATPGITPGFIAMIRQMITEERTC